MSEYRPRPGSGLVAAAALAAGTVALSGCASVQAHQGYVADNALIATVSPGVDNRESVQKTLGRPSFTGEFDPDTTWYYVSRDTKAFAFGSPKPVKQMLLTVRFDKAGNVASVEKGGLEKIARISPDGDKTATRGRHTSFFQDVFGGLGGGGGNRPIGGTADNPTSGR